MSPSEARALIGKTMVPRVVVSPATIRFVIKGISGDMFRIRSSGGHDSREPIVDVALALNRGLLRVEE
jgi:hypothetical protein